METADHQGTKFTGDECIEVGEFAKSFWEMGAIGTPPILTIFMGGVGSGKTTLRRQQCAEGFVHFDFGEIFVALKKRFGAEHPRLSDYACLASNLILKESIQGKRNIAIEIIGQNEAHIAPVIDGMKAQGYEVSASFVNCDPVEAYARHVKAVETDPDYDSAYYSQEATLSFFYGYLDLGPIPEM